jgi:hypothetical protein
MALWTPPHYANVNMDHLDDIPDIARVSLKPKCPHCGHELIPCDLDRRTFTYYARCLNQFCPGIEIARERQRVEAMQMLQRAGH